MNALTHDDGIVFIVDDEEPVRDSLRVLLRSAGIASRGFDSAQAFMDSYDGETHGCLVLDVRMPRMNGMELQQELNRRGWSIPVIFITGHGDVPLAVEAMRAGAVDFLQKPFRDNDLIHRVQKALEQDRRLRVQLGQLEQVRRRYDLLTPREREIASRLSAGQANKVIAMELGLSERTVEQHRANIMRKMETRALAQLVQMLIQITPPADPD